MGSTAAVQAVEECVRGVSDKMQRPKRELSIPLAKDGSAGGLERIWLGDEEGRGPGSRV